MIKTETILSLFLLFFANLAVLTETLSCYQCNVHQDGRVHNCDVDPGQRDGCVACMKSHSTAHLHDQWQETKRIDVTTRYCVRRKTFNRPEGCQVTSSANSGQSKTCFCYSDLCNTAVHSQSPRVITLSLVFVSSIFGFSG